MNASEQDRVAAILTDYKDFIASRARSKIRALLLPSDHTDDLIQDVYLRVIEKVHTFPEPAHREGWLAAIIHWVSREFARRVRRQSSVPLEEVPEPVAEHSFSDASLIHEQETRLCQKQFREALEQLPDRLRHAYYLVKIEGARPSQVMTVLGCSRTTLFERIERAEDELQRLLRYGAVRGRVVDTESRIVNRTSVTLLSLGSGTRREENTKKGVFRFGLVRPGEYRISVTAPGFRSTAQQFSVDREVVHLELELTPLEEGGPSGPDGRGGGLLMNHEQLEKLAAHPEMIDAPGELEELAGHIRECLSCAEKFNRAYDLERHILAPLRKETRHLSGEQLLNLRTRSFQPAHDKSQTWEEWHLKVCPVCSARFEELLAQVHFRKPRAMRWGLAFSAATAACLLVGTGVFFLMRTRSSDRLPAQGLPSQAAVVIPPSHEPAKPEVLRAKPSTPASRPRAGKRSAPRVHPGSRIDVAKSSVLPESLPSEAAPVPPKDVRDRPIINAQASPAAPGVERPQPAPVAARQLTIPAGTTLKVRLGQALSSDLNRPGDTFIASLELPLVVDGIMVAERLARVEGVVEGAQVASGTQRNSVLTLRLVRLQAKDGRMLDLVTSPLDGARPSAAKAAAGAMAGAAVGALVAGAKSTGAAVGAGAALSAPPRSKSVRLSDETQLVFHLSEPLVVSSPSDAAQR
jgi:RNA polymerase sigma-70 factor (ECF subfamily)